MNTKYLEGLQHQVSEHKNWEESTSSKAFSRNLSEHQKSCTKCFDNVEFDLKPIPQILINDYTLTLQVFKISFIEFILFLFLLLF